MDVGIVAPTFPSDQIQLPVRIDLRGVRHLGVHLNQRFDNLFVFARQHERVEAI